MIYKYEPTKYYLTSWLSRPITVFLSLSQKNEQSSSGKVPNLNKFALHLKYFYIFYTSNIYKHDLWIYK